MTSLPDSGALDILANLVKSGGSVQEMCMLASMYLELGEHEKALRYASAAVDGKPTFIPARDLLAKVNVALRDYDSALSQFESLATLARDQHPMPSDECSVPAHFALHNAEQLDHILAGKGDEEFPAGVSAEELLSVRRHLADVIEGSEDEAPWVSVDPRTSEALADPPYVRVSEEKLPRYLNPGVDYGPLQKDIAADRLRARVIDDFLTPEALDQVRKFCLESTVWRHPYPFGYVGAFAQQGFASVSLFAIAEEFSAAIGEAFDGYQLAEWWAFVYDAKLPGTDIHGDDADFSLNLWITPDSANLDPSTGGLVVWDKKAPSDWTYYDYNSGGDRVRQFLQDHNAESHVIPYRENRAVLFEGHLFHRTDDFTFEPGFSNRRRSVTFLFRRRKG